MITLGCDMDKVLKEIIGEDEEIAKAAPFEHVDEKIWIPSIRNKLRQEQRRRANEQEPAETK